MIESWTVTIHYSDGSHILNKKIYTIENLHKYLLKIDKTKTIIGVLLTPKYEETTKIV
jgi:hypothetical protein